MDLNTIVDCGFQAFMDGLPRFLDEIPEVDHINLFLTGVGCVFSLDSACVLD